MIKLRTVLTLLLLTMGSVSFAESTHSTWNAYLSVTDTSDDGLSLKLDDGSEWDIQYFGGLWKIFGWGWTEQNNISHWTCGDTVEIQYPESGNITDFILVIFNTSKNEQALAYLKQAPSTDYPACLWIMDFDKNTSHITLSDGTRWFVTKIDMYGAYFYAKPSTEYNWEVGDPISTIRGEGWLNSNTFMLWNHLTNEMPSVKRIE